MKMDFLLERDHKELDGILRDLLLSLDAGRVEESFKQLDLFWARLGVHIRAENLCLFPAILHELNSGLRGRGDDAPSLDEARQAIARLRTDHDFFMRELASAVKEMRDLRARPGSQSDAKMLRDVRGRVAAVSHRLAAHNELEEERVYRWTNELLDLRAQALLAAKLRREIENLPPRFSGAHSDG
jgi:hemerythrin-like domain-containing protein